jgi:hypothetical protein
MCASGLRLWKADQSEELWQRGQLLSQEDALYSQMGARFGVAPAPACQQGLPVLKGHGLTIFQNQGLECYSAGKDRADNVGNEQVKHLGRESD